MRLGDGDLLGLGVAGQVDDLEPVPQRRRDRCQLVYRRDEQHRGQFERQFDETVAEAIVLLRVEHLEQDGGRRGAELVDLVEHEDRVVAAHPPHLAQDRAGLCISPGAVVAAQVRLVAQSAAGQLHESPPERAAVQWASDVLPTPGGGEAEHRAAARVPPPHGEVLDDARLCTVEAGVPGIERRADLRQLDRRLGATRPRQLLQPHDPVRRLVAVGVGPQPPALPRDGRPHGRGQRLASAQHLPHDGRRDHVRSPTAWPPTLDHPPADHRQLGVELRHARFLRVIFDHPADRLRLEPHAASARRRPPALTGTVARRRPSRRRRQGLQLAH